MKKNILFLLAFIAVVSVKAQWITISNGFSKADNLGRDLRANGGDITKYGDKWYLIGQDMVNGGVNMYSSTNLVDWKFENKIISKETCEELQNGSRFIERPHLIYNASTKKYVIWLHWEGAGYAPAEAAVFYSDEINGNYTYHKGFRPLGNMSRDCNLFLDDDGKAYFISAANNNADLVIYELSNDYLEVERKVITLWKGAYREAPVIFKNNDTYFLLSSGCTGWAPNQGQYAYAKSLEGPWSDRKNLGNVKTYDTQPTCVFPIKGTEGTTFVYYGDRWMDPANTEAKQILLPLQVDGNNLKLDYYSRWDLNLETGANKESQSSRFLPKNSWSIRYTNSEELPDYSASNVLDGDVSTIWHTIYTSEKTPVPHELQIDLGKEESFNGMMLTPRHDGKVDGVVRNYVLYVSSDGVNWNTPVAAGWMTWQTEISFRKVSARYLRLLVYSDFSENNSNITSIAELDLINGSVYSPSEVTPMMKADDKWTSSFDAVVESGSTLTLGVNSTGYGSYCIVGPNGFVGFGKNVNVNNINIKNAGTYTFFNMNQYNSVSSSNANVQVEDKNEIEKGRLYTSIARAKQVCYAQMVGGSDLKSLISEANRLWLNSKSTKEDIISMKQRLDSALYDYVKKNVEIAIDVTDKIVNSNNFTSTSPTGWPSDVLTGVGDGCGEFRNTNFDFSQNLRGMDSGYYLLGVQAFYRNGENDGGKAFLIDEEKMVANLVLGSRSVGIKSLYEHSYSGENNMNGFCNDTKGASVLFSEDSLNYINWVSAYITNDNFDIGLAKTSTVYNDWFCFNNFVLYYLGMTPTSINNTLEEESVEDYRTFNLQGIYCGDWRKVKNNLPKGIYIVNGRKMIVH